jgi:hypothetical protein
MAGVSPDSLLSGTLASYGASAVALGHRAEFRTVQNSSRVRQNGGVPGPPTRNPAPRIHRCPSGLPTVCVECLIGKQKKSILFQVTEPSSVPYRAPRSNAVFSIQYSVIVP